MKMAKPIIVLFVICLIVSTALAMTYAKTKPAIDKVNAEKTKAAAKLVLNGQEGKAYEGVGASFGGDLHAMVGIDKDGKITGVTVLSHSDTPGLGTKAMTTAYLKQYIGLSKLTGEKIKDDKQVDAITGATISSNGVYQAVKDALKKGGAK